MRGKKAVWSGADAVWKNSVFALTNQWGEGKTLIRDFDLFRGAWGGGGWRWGVFGLVIWVGCVAGGFGGGVAFGKTGREGPSYRR